MWSRYYQAGLQERIDSSYVIKASPDAVYVWLKDNWKPPQISENEFILRGTTERKLLERLLLARKTPIIDLGLSQFGYSISALQAVYDRGDAGCRLAALQNPRGSVALRHAGEIIAHGHTRLLKALLSNDYLPGVFFEHLFTRTEKFKDLSDERLMLIMRLIQMNPRLARAYDSKYIDGYADYNYNRPIAAAWDLTRKVTPNKRWAAVLWEVLSRCYRPYGFDDLLATLDRWSIDEPVAEPAQWWNRSESFHVRRLLAGFMAADDALLYSDDAALRASFYERFSPWQYKDWPNFLQKDGAEFANWALQNGAIWQDKNQRERLKRVCWECPDPLATCNLPNDFTMNEERYCKLHPEWFSEPDGVRALPEMEGLGAGINSLSEQLTELTQTVRGLAAHYVEAKSQNPASEVLNALRSPIIELGERIDGVADQIAHLVTLTNEKRRRLF